MPISEFEKLSREMEEREGFGNSLIIVLVAAFIVVIVGWASIAELDNVTRGDGKVVSTTQNQMVQSSESGVILSRSVSENSLVKQGDVLYEINPIELQAELDKLQQRAATLSVRELRLKAESTGQSFAPDSAMIATSKDTAATELALHTAKRKELAGSLSILEQQKAQRQQALIAAEQALETSRNMLELVSSEIAIINPLVIQNIMPETRLLELRREEQRMTGEIQNAITRVASAGSAISEIENQIANSLDSYKRSALEELNAVVAELSEVNTLVPALRERVKRTIIRAPVDGIVNRINFQTVGAYVKAGDVILEIVPTGEALKLEAKIDPKDISSIRLDDLARIRLSAYDSSRYGAVNGHVMSISPDAISENGDSAGTFYLIDVSLDSTITLATGEEVTLLPGMTASVDVVSGKRTVLDYIWQPVAKVKELALRD
ncbi:HlyD family type I secretion periplasmic adaptor subunit [uncultured Lentibacter sp.]|jgi:adhesin transport system membrane fusion protein|uniref:HlyD family type I secretion periplasmic adaptor subunit n=1 Tax=uncultured Lentibacter sp. TaxID=1659309 RepID=UPI00263A128F|nr:HlyD family type I secretion periplasmic adaptor subunit [uncultured Lentibacter sp.]